MKFTKISLILFYREFTWILRIQCRTYSFTIGPAKNRDERFWNLDIQGIPNSRSPGRFIGGPGVCGVASGPVRIVDTRYINGYPDPSPVTMQNETGFVPHCWLLYLCMCRGDPGKYCTARLEIIS